MALTHNGYHFVTLSLIDQNTSLSNIQKFYYLRSALQGNASQVIQSLETTSANYQEAWALLKARFENKRLLIHYQVPALFDLGSIQKESASQLRKLLDNVQKHLRALKTLGQPIDNWDSLIIHMVTTKLDPVTRRRWKTSLDSSNVPTLKMLTEFLMQHCSMLKTLHPGKPLTNKSVKVTQRKAEESIACVSSKGGQKPTDTKNCPICQGEHSIYHCSTFKGLTTQAKWNEIKRINVFFNCLRDDHTSDKCRSGNCKRCGKKHNTQLHIHEFYPKNNTSNDQSTHESGGATTSVDLSNSVTLLSVQINKPHIMLSTALIIIYDRFGKPHTCRAILDCGSQSNFISKPLQHRLQLPGSYENMSVLGIDLSQSHANQRVHATIKSRINAFKVKLPFLVINHITQPVSSAKISTQGFHIPSDIILADPSFSVPSDVDVLLGAGIFWNLLCVGQHIVGQTYPLLHKKLGWIVGGSTGALNTQSENTRSTVCGLTTNTILQDQIEKFWNVEESTRRLSAEEQRCEEEFVASYTRDKDGRFTVALSFCHSPHYLGESRDIAIKQLHTLNRKFSNQPGLKTHNTKHS